MSLAADQQVQSSINISSASVIFLVHAVPLSFGKLPPDIDCFRKISLLAPASERFPGLESLTNCFVMFWQAANQAQESRSSHQEAEQETVWSASPHPAVEQEAAWSASSPHPAVEQEAVWSAPPHSATAPAVISWDSFKSLAKPGDRLRLVGDSIVPSGDANSSQATPFGVVTPAASGTPLVTNAKVAEWAADASSIDQQAGDEAELAGTNNLPAWDGPTMDDAAVGDDHMQWRQTLEAAGCQAEKLLVLAEVTHPVTVQGNIICELKIEIRAGYMDNTTHGTA